MPKNNKYQPFNKNNQKNCKINIYQQFPTFVMKATKQEKEDYHQYLRKFKKQYNQYQDILLKSLIQAIHYYKKYGIYDIADPETLLDKFEELQPRHVPQKFQIQSIVYVSRQQWNQINQFLTSNESGINKQTFKKILQMRSKKFLELDQKFKKKKIQVAFQHILQGGHLLQNKKIYYPLNQIFLIMIKLEKTYLEGFTYKTRFEFRGLFLDDYIKRKLIKGYQLNPNKQNIFEDTQKTIQNTINQFQIGFLQLQNKFSETFIKVFQQKLNIKNKSSIIYFKNGVQYFQIIIQKNNRICYKISFSKNSIEFIFQTQFNSNLNNLLFVLSCPPTFYICEIDSNQYQKGQGRQFHRVPNFIFFQNEKQFGSQSFKYAYLYNHCLKLTLSNQQKNKLCYLLKEKQEISFNLQFKQQNIKIINNVSEKLTLKLFNKFQIVVSLLKNLEQDQKKKKQEVLMLHQKLMKIKFKLIFMLRSYSHRKKLKQILDAFEKKISIQNLDSLEDELNQQFFQENQKQLRQLKSQDIFQFTTLMISPSGVRVKGFQRIRTCRVFRQFKNLLGCFVKVCICQENGKKFITQKYSTNSQYYTQTFLRNKMEKINILGYQFKYLGWSPSQIKKNQLWYIRQDQKLFPGLRKQIRSFMGGNDQILNNNWALTEARFGQGWASSLNTKKWNLIQNFEDMIPDIKSKKDQRLLYSDGIGRISHNLLQIFKDEIKYKINYPLQGICAFQIRYKGSKGVVAVDKTLPDNTLLIRQSMNKRTFEHDDLKKHFDILGTNRYCAGSLNRQIILILYNIGIKGKVFLDIFKQKNNQATFMTYKNMEIISKLKSHLDISFWNNDPFFQVIEYLAKHNLKILQQEPIFQQFLNKIRNQATRKARFNFKIQIDKSARLMGILDQFNILKANQIYCKIQFQDFCQKISERVFLTRNPCHMISDIRVVKCVSQEQIKTRLLEKGIFNDIKLNGDQFSLFKNVIVFPQQGQYPLTSQISGSDLDGDYFLICWDERFIPQQHKLAQIIDIIQQNDVNLKEKKTSYKDALDFFINHMQNQCLGLVSQYLIAWGQQQGLQNKVYKELAKIHSKVIDSSKKGVLYQQISDELKPEFYPTFMGKRKNISKNFQGILSQIHSVCSNHFFQIFIKDTLQRAFLKPLNPHSQQVYRQKQYANQNPIKYAQNFQKFINRLLTKTFSPNQKKWSMIQIKAAISRIQYYDDNIEKILSQNITQEDNFNQFNLYFGKDDQSTSQVLDLKRRIKMFFFFKQQQFQYYQNMKWPRDKIQKFPLCFSIQTYKKAILWYIVSHSNILAFGFSKIKNRVNYQDHSTLLKSYKLLIQYCYKTYKVKYFGMMWFVFPKLMVSLIDNYQQICQKINQMKDNSLQNIYQKIKIFNFKNQNQYQQKPEEFIKITEQQQNQEETESEFMKIITDLVKTTPQRKDLPFKQDELIKKSIREKQKYYKLNKYNMSNQLLPKLMYAIGRCGSNNSQKLAMMAIQEGLQCAFNFLQNYQKIIKKGKQYRELMISIEQEDKKQKKQKQEFMISIEQEDKKQKKEKQEQNSKQSFQQTKIQFCEKRLEQCQIQRQVKMYIDQSADQSEKKEQEICYKQNEIHYKQNEIHYKQNENHQSNYQTKQPKSKIITSSHNQNHQQQWIPCQPSQRNFLNLHKFVQWMLQQMRFQQDIDFKTAQDQNQQMLVFLKPQKFKQVKKFVNLTSLQ